MFSFAHSLMIRAALAALVVASSAARADIAQTPLVLTSTDPASLMLNLSIEFPTVGRAYNPSSSAAAPSSRTYTPGTVYLGYFDHKQCYGYDASQKMFTPQRAADATLECPGMGLFAGNFMNYVSMSAIDIVRMALTGGWRVKDDSSSAGMTVVSRAYLPEDGAEGGVPGFYAGDSNFPREAFEPPVIRRVTPFASVTAPVYVTSCRDRIFFGTTAVGNCSDPDAGPDVASAFPGSASHADASPVLGYFARIQMCVNDIERGSARNDERSRVCHEYVSKTGAKVWKPIGLFQKYSEQTRIGIAGYIIDNVQSRFGGLIRVPLKKTVNEWDPQTGVYIVNPDAAIEGNSGAINFVNKFGLADPSLNPFVSAEWNAQRSQYKVYDTMSEMYYELIQYLRGKQPSPDAYAGITPQMKGGFPALTSWTDPFAAASCPTAYVVALSDANTWCDANLPGNRRTNAACGDFPRGVAADEIDVYGQTRKLGNNLSAISGGALANRPTLADDLTGAASTASYYGAGLAYWAHENDIRPDIAGDQRVITYSIDVNEPSIGLRERQLYLMGLAGGTRQFNANGDPTSYILASSPQLLFNELQNIFASISIGSGSQSVNALSSARLTSGSLSYQSLFRTQTWLGDLQAFNALTNTKVWSAASQLTSNVGRQIITRQVAPDVTAPKGIPFDWDSLTASEKANLNTNELGATDTRGADRLKWIRGDATLEGEGGTAFRSRTDPLLGPTKLGDIVNSSPWVVSAPSAASTENGYGTFASTYFARKRVVYVGANDGMLHGFDAQTGKELLAYVPTQVYPKLSQLSSLDYRKHAFVDGSPMAGDVRFGSGAWKTVLVSPLGAGGRGVFALDVTDPSAFKESNAAALSLWEFSSKDDADLGYIIGRPTVTPSTRQPLQYVRLKVGEASRTAVILGNGEFSTGGTAGAARAALFILFLDKNGTTPWLSGVDYIKLVATNTQYADCPSNGLSMPVPVDANSDGLVDIIYAGDRCGNLWRFNVGPDSLAAGVTSTPSTWGVGLGGNPLFTATSGNVRQPITSTPIAIPNIKANKGYLVLFGTGKLFEPSDPTSTDLQSMFGVWDEDGATTVSASQLRTTSFAPGTTAGTGANLGVTYRSLATNCVRYVATQVCAGDSPTTPRPLQRGWRVDFPFTGERSISNSDLLIDGNSVAAVIYSIVPPATAGCGQGFTSWRNLIDAFDGGSSTTFTFDRAGDGLRTDTLASSSVENSLGSGGGGTVGQVAGPTAAGSANPALPKSTCNRWSVLKQSTAAAPAKAVAFSTCSNVGRQNWREFLRP